MFTGLVETTGILASRTLDGRAGRLAVEVGDWGADAVADGDSVAVEGVCLTVAERADGRLFFDVLEETFRCTSLGRIPEGARLNLERALAHGSRLGGHIVNGHVDGVGAVARVDPVGRDWILGVNCNREIADGIVFKGCISCNGVSLTVAALTENGFEMHLIPETWEVTSLSGLNPGDPVNLEIDIVAKYVRHYLEQGSVLPDLSWEQLRKVGLIAEG